MSHVIKAELKIGQTELDLQALQLTCEQLGLVFCRDKTKHQWYGRWLNDYHGQDAAYRTVDPKTFGTCKHMIRLPWSMHDEERYAQHPEQRPYEIGVVENPDGTLDFIVDNYYCGLGVAELLAKAGGPSFSKFPQLISQWKVQLQVAQQKGHYIKKIEKLGNDNIKMILGVKQTERL